MSESAAMSNAAAATSEALDRPGGDTDSLHPAAAVAARSALLLPIAWLAACGGAKDGAPAALAQPVAAVRRPEVLLPGAPRPAAAPASAPLPTAKELLDWAERRHPSHFPGPRPDIADGALVYRHYPASGNYLGVAAGRVYLLGPLTGAAVWDVGGLADFAPWVLASRVAVDDDAAARFLLHAQFSATPPEVAEVRERGYEAWLQQRFAAPIGQRGWDWLVEKGYDTRDPATQFVGQGYPAEFMVWRALFTAPDAMRQRCALALSEMLVVSLSAISGNNWPQFLGAAYWDLLVEHAFGNFRALLEAITLSPAMGYFLNTAGNQKEDAATGRQPDENYAREVMQLFTIGLVQLQPDGTPQRDAAGQPLPAFDESDVTNLARVFTGYDVDLSSGMLPQADYFVRHPDYARRPMRVDSAKHSALEKNFLGVRIAAGAAPEVALKVALDTLFAHPNVGPFLARQMIQRLVTSDPGPAYVARVAAAFADNGQGVRGDLRALWRAILLDDEARSPDGLTDPRFGKLREPMLRLVQWGRSFGVRSHGGFWKYTYNPRNGVQELLQQPLQAPSVFNFFRPGYVPPGTAMAAVGATAPEFQIVDESSVCSYLNFLCGVLFNGIHHPWDRSLAVAGDLAPTTNAGVEIDVDYSAEVALMPDWPAFVRRLNLMLCAGQLLPATVALIEQQMADLWPSAGNNPAFMRQRVGFALLFLMSAPEYLVQK